jgi:hypothetical protein
MKCSNEFDAREGREGQGCPYKVLFTQQVALLLQPSVQRRLLGTFEKCRDVCFTAALGVQAEVKPTPPNP